MGSYIEKGSQIGGIRMLKVLNQVRKNHTLVKNRKNIIQAQRGKLIGLAMVSSAVLGMVAGIAPIISNAYNGFLLQTRSNGFPLALSPPNVLM